MWTLAHWQPKGVPWALVLEAHLTRWTLGVSWVAYGWSRYARLHLLCFSLTVGWLDEGET